MINMMPQRHKLSKNQYSILNSKERAISRLQLQNFSQYKNNNELYGTDDSYNILSSEFLLTNPNNMIYQRDKHSKKRAVARLRLLQKISQYKMYNELHEMDDSYDAITKGIPAINSNCDNGINQCNKLQYLTKNNNIIPNDDNELYGLMTIDIMLTRKSPVKIINPYYCNNNIKRTINDNANCNKTVVCVLTHNYPHGFGDYLRGSISIAHYAKYFGINFKLSMNTHLIGKYVINNNENAFQLNEIKNIHGHSKYNEVYDIFTEFMKSNENILYITTNLIYSMKLPTQDIKNTINSFLTFKPKYYEMAEQMFNLKKYDVIHIRCSDECFDTKLNTIKINTLFKEIKNLQLSSNTIIMSNNYSLKKLIHETLGFYFIDKKSVHTAKEKNLNELESTIIEYIILSKSSHTYCFTCYNHGSGFSEHCSVLNNIPYQVTFVDI